MSATGTPATAAAGADQPCLTSIMPTPCTAKHEAQHGTACQGRTNALTGKLELADGHAPPCGELLSACSAATPKLTTDMKASDRVPDGCCTTRW
jgi:hypothetical protein